MGGPLVYTKVLEYFRERPNIEVTITELEKATGLTRERIMNSVHTLRRQGETVDTPRPGYSYVYRGTTRKENYIDKRMFEEVGVLKSGAIIIQDEDGNLYRAEEIK